MNRDQRSIVCKRIDSIAEERCRVVVKARDEALAALKPPVATYLEMLKKSKPMQEAVLKQFMAGIEDVLKTGCYSRYISLQLYADPDTVVDVRGSSVWQPKEYPALCQKHIDAREDIKSLYQDKVRSIHVQAEKLKVKIMLLGLPEAILRMLDDFEKGIDIEE